MTVDILEVHISTPSGDYEPVRAHTITRDQAHAPPDGIVRATAILMTSEPQGEEVDLRWVAGDHIIKHGIVFVHHQTRHRAEYTFRMPPRDVEFRVELWPDGSGPRLAASPTVRVAARG